MYSIYINTENIKCLVFYFLFFPIRRGIGLKMTSAGTTTSFSTDPDDDFSLDRVCVINYNPASNIRSISSCIIYYIVGASLVFLSSSRWTGIVVHFIPVAPQSSKEQRITKLNGCCCCCWYTHRPNLLCRRPNKDIIGLDHQTKFGRANQTLDVVAAAISSNSIFQKGY